MDGLTFEISQGYMHGVTQEGPATLIELFYHNRRDKLR